MTVPVWMLLGFATWTVLLLLTTVGVYRWSRILTGRAPIREFRADRVEGEEWYKRAMRAHANCVENLPVFGAIVFAQHARGGHHCRCAGGRSPCCPHRAIDRARSVRSDKHGCIVPLRVLFRANPLLSRFGRNCCHWVRQKRMTDLHAGASAEPEQQTIGESRSP